MKKIKVQKVIDGDTFKGSRDQYFRLSEIDTPEKDARGFKKAKETLVNMIEGQNIFVKEVGESYGRKVVVARVEGQKMTVNEKMKRKGYNA